jgi:hypothetical protein
MNLIKFPTPKKSRTKKIQPITTILIVDFKKKELVGEMAFDNLKNTLVNQWGQQLTSKKKVA